MTPILHKEPTDRRERLSAALMRWLLRVFFRLFVGPPFGARVQRAWVALLSALTPSARGVTRNATAAGHVHIEVTQPPGARTDAAILYLHGGAFCVGSPATHRPLTARLALDSGLPVWAPDYRLAPEHPYPAGLDDVIASFQHLQAQGIAPEHIVVGGDSAGGSLTIALALRLKAQGLPQPGGLMLISPATDPSFSGESATRCAPIDPLLRPGWLTQAVRWYACPPDAPDHAPLLTDLSGLPPTLLHVGDQEVLYSDAVRYAEHAERCGVDVRLDIYQGRWHVFHLQTHLLRSAREAVRALAAFAVSRVSAARGQTAEKVC